MPEASDEVVAVAAPAGSAAIAHPLADASPMAASNVRVVLAIMPGNYHTSIADAAHYRAGKRFRRSASLCPHRLLVTLRRWPGTRLAYPVLHPVIARNCPWGFERELVCNTFAGSIRARRPPDQRDGGRDSFPCRTSRPNRDAAGDLRGDRGAHPRWPTPNQPARRPSCAGTADTAGDRSAADPVR